MANTADAVIGAAATQIGYFVRPGQPTKFGQWYGLPIGQWCAMFVSWAAEQAGAQDIIPKHAYTPAGAQWFRSHGQWHVGTAGIRRGDIAYFDFPGAPNRISHVGIVESVMRDGSVITIEGNTSGPTGDQRNGGACLRKQRRAYIVGYGRPKYLNVTQGPPASARPTNADGSERIDQDGERGPRTIARWQEVMNTPVDGKIDKGFSRLIKADQEFLNTVVDPNHIRNLTGRGALATDGDEGPRTVIVRQFWLRNSIAAGHQQNLIGRQLGFDGVLGPQTNTVHQWALNQATRGSKRY